MCVCVCVCVCVYVWGFPGDSLVEYSPAMQGTRIGSLGWESLLEQGMTTLYSNKNLQCFCLKNPMDRGAWWALVHGVTELDATEVT